MRTPLALALAAPIALAPLAALAQDAQAPETTPEMTQEMTPETSLESATPDAAADAFDEATLQAFVDAVVALEDVRAEYAPRVEAAPEADKPALIEEANVAMVAAVEETDGITLEDYLAVNEAASQDPELAQRIVALLPADMQQQQDAAPEG